MQFAVIAHDYSDDGALARRLSARNQHIAISDAAIRKGEQILGVAILDNSGNACGSIMVVDFPTREAVDNWLANEPYVIGKVWEKIEVVPCKIGPSFANIVSKFSADKQLIGIELIIK